MPIADRPSAWFRQQVSRPAGLQAAGQDEHARGRGGQGPLQVHPLLPHPHQPTDLHAEHGGDGPGGPRAEGGHTEVVALH